MQIFKNANYDFIRWRWHALVLSSIVIVGGLAVTLARNGMPLGIDFTGGTILVLRFEQPVTDAAVRNAIEVLPGEKVVQQYGDPAQHEILIRFPQAQSQEQGFGLEASSRQAITAITKANIGKFDVLSTEVVGPVVGKDLQRKGIWATIAGYSVNDTIVVFDRVRENMRLMRREPLDKIVNTSVNQTLGRTIITSGTTLLAVLALYLFGGEVLKGFAFAMLVGVITGTYSTIFIAATIAIILSRCEFSRRAAAAPVKGAASTTSASEQPRKPGRNVRVS